MGTVKLVWLFASVGLYVALCLVPGDDEHSQKILHACFDFGYFSPLTWYRVVVAVFYAPVPFIILAWMVVRFYLRNNDIEVPHSFIGLLHLMSEIQDDPLIRRAAAIALWGAFYCLAVMVGWIAYAAAHGV